MTTRRRFVARAAASAAIPFVIPGTERLSRVANGSRQTSRLTFVLVHGGWTGGWIWQPVARLLRAGGHEVVTPTMTGFGERVHLASPEIDLTTHIDDIVNVLRFEELHDVVLVGHSYAGMVITGVAERVPERLSRLVYLDAYVPRDGQSLADLLPDELVAQFIGVAEEVGDGWRIPHNPPDADRRTDFPLAAGLEPLEVGNPAAAQLPRAYIACLESRGIPLYGPFTDAAIRAQEEGWDYAELPTGHHPMETMPNELAETLLALA